jgi:hypothetical protein
MHVKVLAAALRTGEVCEEDLVRSDHAGIEDWTRIQQLPELLRLLKEAGAGGDGKKKVLKKEFNPFDVSNGDSEERALGRIAARGEQGIEGPKTTFKVLRLLSLLVQKYKYQHLSSCVPLRMSLLEAIC